MAASSPIHSRLRHSERTLSDNSAITFSAQPNAVAPHIDPANSSFDARFLGGLARGNSHWTERELARFVEYTIS